MLLLPLLFVGFFTVMIVSAVVTQPGARLALGNTARVAGTVLQVKEDDNCGRQTRTIQYEFKTLAGPPYRGASAACQHSLYDSVKAGDAIPIKYLITDPSVNALDVNGNNNSFVGDIPLLIMPIMFFCLFFLPFALPVIKPILDARKLVRLGVITEGLVVFVKPRPGFHWPGAAIVSSFDVIVRFRDELGLEREASTRCSNAWLVNHLGVGTAVHIAYRIARPKRAALLEAFIR